MDAVIPQRRIRGRKLSRYRRVDEDKTITLEDIYKNRVLTAKDKEILLALYYHRCLTSNQLAEMFYLYRKDGKKNLMRSAQESIRRRLRKLFDWKVIERFFPPAPENEGSMPQHVVLDTLGANIVAGLLGTTIKKLDWRYEMTETKLPYLDHMVEVNDFYIYLLRAARENGHKVKNFRVENHNRHEFKINNYKKVILQPDAYGQYWIDDDTGFHFFLEWDRGTMTPQQFSGKYNRYYNFLISDECKRIYGNMPPVVLTVTPDAERAYELYRTIYAVNTEINWLFAPKPLVETKILEQIWIGKEGTPVSLLEL